MSDRRRLNGPAGGTQPAQFLNSQSVPPRVRRTRQPNELRKIFLQTGLIPSADGSAYYELEAPAAISKSLIPITSTIKLSCAVYGPKPLPRNSNFSPNLQLTASVKFAPFASNLRRGYIRDSTERDLGVHLESALKGVVIQDRWPKSAVDVFITVLEGEDTTPAFGDRHRAGVQTVGLMNILAGCITAASAALLDARIDCLDLMTGGVAASSLDEHGKPAYLLDPSPAEEDYVQSACVVGYLPSRDEIAEVWTTGNLSGGNTDHEAGFDAVLDKAVGAARAVQTVLKEVLVESASRNDVVSRKEGKTHGTVNDIEMKE